MLAVGARIQGKLIEEIEKDHWIVSFQGELFQVRNSTNIKFESGMKLNLKVVNERPFQLQVLSQALNRNLKLDVRA